jgi:hypothetical protein
MSGARRAAIVRQFLIVPGIANRMVMVAPHRGLVGHSSHELEMPPDIQATAKEDYSSRIPPCHRTFIADESTSLEIADQGQSSQAGA